jgi:hypothetical protein
MQKYADVTHDALCHNAFGVPGLFLTDMRVLEATLKSCEVILIIKNYYIEDIHAIFRRRNYLPRGLYRFK